MDTIKFIANEVCVFDCEYVPDVEAGRRALDLDPVEYDDADVVERMQSAFGDERGIMKSVFYRIVSIAALVRRYDVATGQVKLNLFSIPADEDFDEAKILTRFLTYLGEKRPQLVGFASHTFDLAGLWQRAIVNRIDVHAFTERPAKPWDDGADYFATTNAMNIDLVKIVGNYGSTVPRLEQIAACCRIPAKLGLSGDKVAGAWLEGRRREIVDYNECDALTTYLLWLQIVETHGLLSHARANEEREALHALLDERRELRHLSEFQDAWRALEPADDAAPVEVETTDSLLESLKENIKPQSVHVQEREQQTESVNDNVAKSLADLVTQKQLGLIRHLASEKRYDVGEFCSAEMGCHVSELSKRAASEFIDKLKAAEVWTNPAQQSLLDATVTPEPVNDLVPAIEDAEGEWYFTRESSDNDKLIKVKVPTRELRKGSFYGMYYNATTQTVDLYDPLGEVYAFNVKPLQIEQLTIADDDIPF